MEPEGRSLAIRAEEAPTDEQRSFIQNRVAEISASLTPASSEDLLAEMWALLRTMAVRNGAEEELAAVVKVYVADLEDLPLWAVSAACRAYRRGDIGNGTFAPTPGEVRKRAKIYLDHWVDERAKLERILDARVMPKITAHQDRLKEQTLAHVAATVEALKAATFRDTGRGSEDTSRPLTINEAQAALDRYQANPPPMPKLSPLLRGKMGLPQEDDGSFDRFTEEDIR